MRPADVFHRAHARVRQYDLAFVDCFTADGVLELPFAHAPMPKRVQGREAIRALMAPRYEAARAAGRRIVEYANLMIHETTDPEVIVVEFEVIGGAGRAIPYTSPFIHVLRVVGDEIALQRDYFDSLAMAERLRVS
jgi:hypothetical protein